MNKITVSIFIVIFTTLAGAGATAAVPDMIPMQGVLLDADDEPIDDLTDITFTLYADGNGTTVLWTDTFAEVDVVNGFFTVYLGSNASLDFALLTSNDEIWVGVTVAEDPEMDLFQLTSVPFAVEAQVCGAVGSLTEEDINTGFLPSTYVPDWSELTGVPTDISEDLDPNNELNTSVVLNGNVLEVTDPGGVLTADLSTLLDDADADPSNELNTSIVLNGTNLEITDSGGTLVAGLAALVNDADANPANELNTSVILNGTDLELTDPGGTIITDLSSLVSDGDADSTNELNTSVVLSGTELQITDSGGTLTAELGSLVDTASDILAKLTTVDGSGSGLDADLLDGLDASDIIDAAGAANDDRVYIDSIPYTITEPGYYILKGNLTATVVNGDGITIDSDFVTLDLNGFTLDGTTRADPPGIATDDGIVVLGDQRGITIRNGVVANWGGDGINALNADNSLFENLIVFNNGGDGLVTDFACVIKNCTARLNGIDGLETDDGSVIVDSTAYENGDNGIQTSEGCTVTNCSSFKNGSDGFDIAAGSVIQACSATDNQLYGFDIALGSQVIGCTAYDNVRNGFDIASACVAVDNISSLNNENGFRTFANAYLRNNKAHENDRAGFRISSTDVYVDANNATDNDDGGFVNTSSGSLFVRNTSAGNILISIGTNAPDSGLTNDPLDPAPSGTEHQFYLDPSSAYGPVVDVTGAGNLSGLTNSDHPLANLTY